MIVAIVVAAAVCYTGCCGGRASTVSRVDSAHAAVAMSATVGAGGDALAAATFATAGITAGPSAAPAVAAVPARLLLVYLPLLLLLVQPLLRLHPLLRLFLFVAA